MKSSRALCISAVLAVLGIASVVADVPPAAAAGGFTVSGSLATPRANAVAASLSDGDVLVAGGQDGSGTPLASAELYDPATGTWKATGSLNVPVTDATATVLSNGQVLVAGGLTTSSGSLTPTTTSELYDPSSGTWSTTGTLETASYDGGAVLQSTTGDVLYVGGLTGTGSTAAATNVVELYDASAGTWSTTAALPLGVAEAEVSSLSNGEVLVAGGETGASGELTGLAEVYSDGSWSAVDQMNTAVATAAVTSLSDGEVLVAGGETSTNGTSTATSELFNPADGTWSSVGSLPTASYGATATLLSSGEVLYAGGLTSSEGAPTSTVALFDPSSKDWTATSSLQLARGFAIAARLSDGDVLVASGQTSSGVTGESERYAAGTAPAITSTSAVTLRAGTFGSFTVTATGSPTPELTEAGALPSGISFHANGDGTATISGTAPTDTSGTWTLTITASNGVGSPATQHLAVSFVPLSQAAVITSADFLAVRAGVYTDFLVTTSGAPVPSVTEYGSLPPGLSFRPNGNGTATISGIPPANATGTYVVTIRASNGVGATAIQSLSIAFPHAPAITSSAHVVVHAGVYSVFTVTSSGSPLPTFSELGALPPGLVFRPNGDGTASIYGTPPFGTSGRYELKITATNGYGSPAVQELQIGFPVAAAITSHNSLSLQAGSKASFTVTTNGWPYPTLTESGALPPGLSFKAGSDGTATISGIVDPKASGTYTLSVKAANGVGATAAQALRITVAASAVPTVPSGVGYWYVTRQAELLFKGSARPIAALTPQHPSDVMAMAVTPDQRGYYLVSGDGGVFNYGDARFYGSIRARHLSTETVAIAVTAGDGGYYLVTRAGNVLGFGDARFYGSTANRGLPPIAAFALTPDGRGYWLVSVHGNVYGFGDAGFSGSPARLRIPTVTAFARTPDGRGYWVVTTRGDVYPYGDAGFYGSLTGRQTPPVVAFEPTRDGRGYWLVTTRGNVFNLGDARFYGSSAHARLFGAVTGFAAGF